MALGPAIIDPRTGAVRNQQPRTPNAPAPWTVPSPGQNNGPVPYGTPTYLPGVTAPPPAPNPATLPGNLSGFITNSEGNFVSGNPYAYADTRAGMRPELGNFQDATSLVDRNVAQNNYGAGVANLDQSENGVRTSFEEMLNSLNKNRTRSTTSLADSMADRGLSQSGIYLNQTADLQNNFNDQLSGQTHNRDSQLNSIQQNRVNLSNQLAQALAAADQAAYDRRLASFQSTYDQALKTAMESLRQQGLVQ